MDLVCTDLDGISSWYYEAATKSYSRLKPNGDQDTAGGKYIMAKIFGRDIPNPDKLWLARCTLAGTTTGGMNAPMLKPSPTVYSLFSHWQGVKDA